MKLIVLVLAMLFGFASATVVADQKPGSNPESPSDDNAGTGNDPPGGAGGSPPGQTTNPNPSKLYEPGPAWLAEFVVAQNTAPGSGNWGGGPGNSGPGDQNGANDKSKDGGQTPHDDK